MKNEMTEKSKNPLGKSYDFTEGIIVKILENFVFLAMLAMVLLVFINVIGRYFFQSGITESEELAKILFVWICFVGAILCFQADKHIIVDVVLTFLPKIPKRIFNIISNLCVSAILLYTIYHCGNFIKINQGMLSPLTKIPMPLIQSIVPGSMILMLLMNIRKLLALFSGLFYDISKKES